MSLTLWSPWASAVCECEQSLGLETQDTEGGGGFEEGFRYWDQGGGKVCASRASRAFLCHLLLSMPLAAVGYLDGTLAIYDLSTQTLRHQCQHQV